MADELTTDASTDRPQPKRVATLVELYTGKGAKAQDLLADLARRGQWRTDEADQAAALMLLSEADHDLARTRTLALHAAVQHESRFAGGLQDFLSAAIGDVLGEVPGWPLSSEQVDGTAVFVAIVDKHREVLGAKEPQRRLFNAVMIAQTMLMARHGLEVHQAVPVLGDALGPPLAAREPRYRARVERLRAIGDTRLTVERLRSWLDVLSPWIRRATEAERDARQQTARAEALAEQQAMLLERISSLEEERELGVARLRDAQAALEAARERERGSALARDHHSAQLRGTAAGFLADEVLPLLEAAQGALRLDPPRAPFALEKIDDTTHAIEERLQWLKSSG